MLCWRRIQTFSGVKNTSWQVINFDIDTALHASAGPLQIPFRENAERPEKWLNSIICESGIRQSYSPVNSSEGSLVSWSAMWHHWAPYETTGRIKDHLTFHVHIWQLTTNYVGCVLHSSLKGNIPVQEQYLTIMFNFISYCILLCYFIFLFHVMLIVFILSFLYLFLSYLSFVII